MDEEQYVELINTLNVVSRLSALKIERDMDTTLKEKKTNAKPNRGVT